MLKLKDKEDTPDLFNRFWSLTYNKTISNKPVGYRSLYFDGIYSNECSVYVDAVEAYTLMGIYSKLEP